MAKIPYADKIKNKSLRGECSLCGKECSYGETLCDACLEGK